jgi:hypothetical protein
MVIESFLSFALHREGRRAGFLLDCPANLSINADSRSNDMFQHLPSAFSRCSHVAEDAEISCGFGFASRLVFLYARGRDMYRVPIES